MRRDMFQKKIIRRLYKKIICAAVSAALLTAWPMAANSEEYNEDEVGEEALASFPVEDGLLENTFSEDSDTVWEESVIGEDPVEESDDLFEDFTVEEDVDQEAGFLEEDETEADNQDAISVLEEISESEALLQEEEEADEALSGECGVLEGTVFWELDEEGTLHITGEGEMADWESPEDVPWAHLSELVKALDIQDGITGIGSYAFTGCTDLTTARIG